METSKKTKAERRRELRARLKGLSGEERKRLDEALSRKAQSLLEVLKAETVYGYASLPWEAGTDELLSFCFAAGKRVALPRVCGEEMAFFEVSSLEDLEEGAYHIREPKADCPPANFPGAVVLVPGMAFTEAGQRLGKGGGYYDRFLSREPDHLTIALAYEFQMAEDLPNEPHDRAVDVIVTDKEIRRIAHADRNRKESEGSVLRSRNPWNESKK